MNPIFKLTDLKSVLNAIRFTQAIPQNALQDHLIEINVISGHMVKPLSDHYIATWLHNTILCRYNQRRMYHQLPELNCQMPKGELLEHIQADYLQMDTDLESWSTMFIDYGGLLFSISSTDHERIAGLTTRTLCRRRHRGYDLLYLEILLS